MEWSAVESAEVEFSYQDGLVNPFGKGKAIKVVLVDIVTQEVAVFCPYLNHAGIARISAKAAAKVHQARCQAVKLLSNGAVVLLYHQVIERQFVLRRHVFKRNKPAIALLQERFEGNLYGCTFMGVNRTLGHMATVPPVVLIVNKKTYAPWVSKLVLPGKQLAGNLLTE